MAVVAGCIAIVGLILLAAYLGSQSKRDQGGRRIGDGRDPDPGQLIHDPDWKPSGIKGQGGGPFG